MRATEVGKVVLAIVILSVFAFYGIFLILMEFMKINPCEKYDAGFRVILAVPENAEERLEGVIRGAFSDEIPDKLLTDGKLYLAPSGNNPQIIRIIRDMQRVYPIEVLPRHDRYCMITGSKNDADR